VQCDFVENALIYARRVKQMEIENTPFIRKIFDLSEIPEETFTIG